MSAPEFVSNERSIPTSNFSDDIPASFSEALGAAMKRPTYRVTPGLLSKLSGVPRATIVNWLESRVSRPRNTSDLLKVADALRLDDIETAVLLRAAGHASANPVHTQMFLRGSADRPTPSKADLPARLTELIGREKELGNIVAACQEPAMRLLTLVGTGGIGKTHLAISAATRLKDMFPRGIAWVPLTACDDPAELVPAIASAIGARESSTASAFQTITNALHGKRALLVLDNVEHLVPGIGRLAELLEALPLLVVLATSRIALGIRGERVFRVEPLALPAPDRYCLERVAASPAVTLFLARAAAIGKELSSEEDLATVAAICIRLEGLPLAIELAASWTRLLKPQALLERLKHRLTFLRNGARDGALRHRSLRDTIAWSYGLLSEPQRSLFRRLAVLSDISFASAAAVSGLADHEMDDTALLDVLTALVDHNLLKANTISSARELRLDMLETIREFAVEMLIQNEEYEETRRLHAAYFVSFAESVDASFLLEPTVFWLSRLQSEHENFRAALTWLFEDVSYHCLGARLVTALSRYWFERGLFRDARRWLDRARMLGNVPDVRLSARVALYCAFVANYEGDYMAGAAAAEKALEAYALIADIAGCMQARSALGIAALYTGAVDQAEDQFTQTLTVQRERGDKRGIAVALHNLGEVAAECRFAFRLAEERYEESLALFREIGHTLNVASTLGALGELQENRGDLPRAIAFALQALEAYAEVDNRPLIAEGLTRLARYELLAGNRERSQQLLARAVRQVRISFNPRHVADCFAAYASLARAGATFDKAAVCLGYSQQVRDVYRVPLLPASHRRYDALTNSVRSQLETATFEELWQRGYALHQDEAFEAISEFLPSGVPEASLGSALPSCDPVP